MKGLQPALYSPNQFILSMHVITVHSHSSLTHPSLPHSRSWSAPQPAAAAAGADGAGGRAGGHQRTRVADQTARGMGGAVRSSVCE